MKLWFEYYELWKTSQHFNLGIRVMNFGTFVCGAFWLVWLCYCVPLSFFVVRCVFFQYLRACVVTH